MSKRTGLDFMVAATLAALAGCTAGCDMDSKPEQKGSAYSAQAIQSSQRPASQFRDEDLVYRMAARFENEMFDKNLQLRPEFKNKFYIHVDIGYHGIFTPNAKVDADNYLARLKGKIPYVQSGALGEKTVAAKLVSTDEGRLEIYTSPEHLGDIILYLEHRGVKLDPGQSGYHREDRTNSR